MNAIPSNQVEPRLLDAEAELLIAYIRDETDVQNRLLERLEEKERCLVKQVPDEIANCLNETAPIVSRIEEMAHRRVRILKRLGQRVGLRPDEVDLKTLLLHTPPELQERLEDARVELREILCRIGVQNRKNLILVRNGIELNQNLVQAIFGCSGISTYDRSGQSQQTTPKEACLSQEL